MPMPMEMQAVGGGGVRYRVMGEIDGSLQLNGL